MEEISVFDKIGQLFNLVVSSPFFLLLFISLVLTIILLIINVKVKCKIFKTMAIIVYVAVIIFVFFEYGSSITTLSDGLMSKIFTTIYFPNFISYICMLIIAILFFMMTMINNQVSKIYKITNIGAFLIIMFLFVLTIDVITKNDINIYEKTSIYSNQTLIVLIQSSMSIFALWFAILIVDSIVNYMIRKKNKEKIVDHMLDDANRVVVDNNVMATITDDDFSILSEESFYNSYKKYEKKRKYEEYMSIAMEDSEEQKNDF